MTYITISDFADDFDFFIIDLWGVLHDGQKPYPEAIKTLTRLKKSGKTIVLLSNAPRRAERAVDVLSKIGFEKSMYDSVMTSGEAAYNSLKNSDEYEKFYYYIGSEKDKYLLSGLDYKSVSNIKDADFALVTGFENDNSTLDENLQEITACREENLKLICVNPDRRVVRQDGSKMLCAGIIAEEYERMGGRVIYFGKPYKDVYQRCFELFGTDDTSRIAAIGDSLHTDIKGANNIGIFSALVTGGILAKELEVSGVGEPNQTKLRELCSLEGAMPDVLLSLFSY